MEDQKLSNPKLKGVYRPIVSLSNYLRNLFQPIEFYLIN